MQRPVAKITVDDPRKWGRPAGGWSGDFPFSVEGYNSPWVLKNAEEIPSLNAIGPRGIATRQDMLFAQWIVEDGEWDDRSRPSGNPRTRYLHMYEGSVGAVGRVVSVEDFPPCWCAWIKRYVPPEGSTLACDFSIKMQGAGLGYPSWRLVVPTQNAVNKWPYLSLDPYSTGHAKQVSHLQEDTTSGMDSGEQNYVIWCELTCNQWIIAISVNGKPAREAWVYTPPGTDVGNPFLLNSIGNQTPICSPGKLEIQTQGQQLMVAVAPIKYPLMAEAFLRKYYHLDDRFGDALTNENPFSGGFVGSGVIVAPTGTSADVTVDTAHPNDFGPRVTMWSSDNVRPVCGMVSVSKPAAITDVTTDPWVSTGQKLKGVISYTRRSTWKGNEFSATIKNAAGDLAWNGNNVAYLEAAYQTTGGVTPTYKRLVTGYLQGPTSDEDGNVPLEVTIRAADFAGSRMARKRMIFHQSYGGMLFPDAFAAVGNRLGFAANRITVDASFTAVYLPTGQIIGDPTFAYGATDKPENALDEMCKAVGARWGLDAAGLLFARPAPAYVNTTVFTLDSDTTTPADYIKGFSHRRDLADYANDVYTLAGPEGYRQIAWAQNLLSQDTDTVADFIGDSAQYVEVLERCYGNALTIATLTLGKRSEFSDVLVWRPMEAHPTIDPGMFCKAQIDGAQIVTDGIYMVVEERGELDPEVPCAFGWRQEFTMVRVA